MMTRRSTVLAMTFSLASFATTLASTAQASAFDSLEALSQEDFKTMVENLGAATHYRALTPTEPLGIIGFDVGVSVSATSIDERVLDLASEGNFEIGRIPIPRLHAHKGLPFGIDIGAFASAVPETDIKLLGAEVRYALLEGSALTPAVGVRAGFSTLQGLDDLEMTNMSADVSISKGFLLLTPYAGVGIVRTTGKAGEEFGFTQEVVTQNKVYAGLNVNFGVNLALEADQTGDYTTFGAKVGFRF